MAVAPNISNVDPSFREGMLILLGGESGTAAGLFAAEDVEGADGVLEPVLDALDCEAGNAMASVWAGR
ncbi:hypothetical protein [Allobranchiibius sp. CTAmp26]|uniref:hypothetical protein n=1 Tax=Allobranchiibius sp. CTAmp26 TaxID=2815214 RepID=UPI001FB6075D|nr:hypothetical protein [Allobranchiibius sp. CTAmp26]